MTKVFDLPMYSRAADLSHLEGSLYVSCMNAEFAEEKGNVVYFRNYKDTNLEYIEFCFTKINPFIAKFEYVSYVEYE